MVDVKTRSQEQAEEVSALLRARNPLLWIVTGEEQRVESYIFESAAAAGYLARTWDVGQGVTDISGRPAPMGSQDPGDTLDVIAERSRGAGERGVWIMRDLHKFVVNDPVTQRKLRNLARLLPSVPRESAQAIIVISPSGDIPPELANHATVINWPLPDRTEVARNLDATIAVLPDDMQSNAAPNGTRDAAIDAAVGLSGLEASACYRKSLVQLQRIDPVTVAREKKRIIAREKVLEWIDPLDGGLDSVGGLDVLKSWLVSRRSAYSAAARDYGLPPPKGVLLVGVPGCGKSLTAKAIATAWGVPLLKLDLGALKSKFVGESEGNLRKALGVIEAIGRCVVWIDEIEKTSLASASQGSADGGVSSDALGAMLNFMQERKSEAFIVATSNDAEKLPPELLRKGRFDELWFVDLPNVAERGAIIGAALAAHKRAGLVGNGVDAGAVADATEGFSGAEIAALVPDALFVAFADGQREITTTDLLTAAKSVVPLAKTAASKIAALQAWQEGKARKATTPLSAAAKERTVTLDL